MMKFRRKSSLFDRIGVAANHLGDKIVPFFAPEKNQAGDNAKNKPQGFVAIVGAGPGDPELLTVKAHNALKSADVVVFDRLVNPEILKFARNDAARIDVGKSPRRPSIPQSRINNILVREALAGKFVIRLKGGDPFTFARGGEELAALQAAGIAAKVIPGITAAAGCAAAANLPLTDRRSNKAITLLTGATASGAAEQNWSALADKDSAFVVYMGVGAAAHIENRLRIANIDPQTPVVIIENGTLPQERIIETNAQNIALAVSAMAIKGPALIFVGLDWESRNLIRPARVESFVNKSHTHSINGISLPPLEQHTIQAGALS